MKAFYFIIICINETYAKHKSNIKNNTWDILLWAEMMSEHTNISFI